MRTKSVYKMRILLLVFSATATCVASAQTSTRTFAFTQFLDPQGNTGAVAIMRTVNSPLGVTTTQMSYSFCLQTTATQCAEGTGNIPNSDLTSNLNTHLPEPATLTLLADTSTIADFSNSLCINPSILGCSSIVPAGGGVVNVTFSKTADSAQIISSQTRQYENRMLTSIVSDDGASYSGTMLGTLLGTPAQSAANQAELSFEKFTFIFSAPASGVKQSVESSKYQQLEYWLNSQPQGHKTVAWLKRVGMLPR